VASTWATSGARGFFAGNFADVIRTAPQKSVQLAAFDAYKKLLGRRNKTTGRMETSGLATTLAGAAAGVTSTITCFPLEVLRTRLAVSSQYKNLVHAAVSIVRQEGPKALYGGLGPSLAGVIPYAGANLGMYDGLRWAYCRSTGEERVPKAAALLIGALAGVSAATATFPLEVVRRRMMMGCVRAFCDALFFAMHFLRVCMHAVLCPSYHFVVLNLNLPARRTRVSAAPSTTTRLRRFWRSAPRRAAARCLRAAF
jgi:hypothetical protein